MQIVDSQIHIWGKGLPSNDSHIQVTSFTAGEAITLMDEGGVHAAIIHPPIWDPDALELATNAVIDYPNRFAIMGHLSLNKNEASRQLPVWRNKTGMLGLRYTFLNKSRQKQLHAGEFEWLWTGAENYGIPISALCTDSLTYFGEIAERHPKLRITIDHFGGRGGNTILKDDDAMKHIPTLLKLAKFPNVSVKASGAPGYSAEEYPFPIMQRYLRQVFDAFGPARTFWGTDITKMPCSWAQCVSMFTEKLTWLNAEDLNLVMGKAICDWWGWNRKETTL